MSEAPPGPVRNGWRAPLLWPKELSLHSLRGRIALVLALAFLPTGVLAFQAGWAAVSARDAAVQQAAGVRALAAMAPFRDELSQMREVARTLAANATLFADNRRLCGPTLSQLSATYPDYSSITILRRDGTVECAHSAGMQGRTTSARPLIEQAALTGDVAVGYVPAPRLTGSAVIGAVARAESMGFEPELFVGLTEPVGPLLDTVLSAADTTDFALLTDQNGAVLATRGATIDPALLRELQGLIRAGVDEPSRLDGALRVGGSWVVASAMRADGFVLVRGWRSGPPSVPDAIAAGWALSGPVLLWAIAVAAAWFAIELFVARPLTVVERLARTYARGEDSESDELLLRTAPEEISSLRRTLAAMAKTLRGREARLTAALQEERALLREVNHRVKNNLQMVASILSIQGRGALEPAEARGLARAKDRVQLLALAHTHIYASGQVHDVSLDGLTGDIVRALVGARGAEVSNVRIRQELEPVRTRADRAVPFAFVIGEVLTHALDRLPRTGETSLRLALWRSDDAMITFEIEAPDALPLDEQNAATHRLLDAFARQLTAKIVRRDDQGFALRIEAAEPPLDEPDED